MKLDIKTKNECGFDALSLGEIMLRLDPGDMRIRNRVPQTEGTLRTACTGIPSRTFLLSQASEADTG